MEHYTNYLHQMEIKGSGSGQREGGSGGGVSGSGEPLPDDKREGSVPTKPVDPVAVAPSPVVSKVLTEVEPSVQSSLTIETWEDVAAGTRITTGRKLDSCTSPSPGVPCSPVS